jgi:hypothetical protein
MSKITLTLKSIECLKTNETGKDELYLMLNIKDLAGQSVELKEKFPKNEHGFWHLATGDKLELNEVLFHGDILRGIIIDFRFMEEDKTSGTTLSAPLEEIIDDFIGEFRFIIESSGKVIYEDVRHSKLKEKVHKDYYISVSGSGADYHLWLEVK